MSKDSVTLYKWFWADQDTEQEQWLREKAQQGLHLKGVNPFCGFTFARGVPEDVVYRLDFHNKWDTASYRQLFADDGWEHAAALVGWQYWRKRAGEGAEPRIFTDMASHMTKYKQVLVLLAVCTLPLVAMLLRPNSGTSLDLLSAPALVLLGVTVFVGLPINAYGAWRLMKRIRRLRAETL